MPFRLEKGEVVNLCCKKEDVDVLVTFPQFTRTTQVCKFSLPIRSQQDVPFSKELKKVSNAE